MCRWWASRLGLLAVLAPGCGDGDPQATDAGSSTGAATTTTADTGDDPPPTTGSDATAADATAGSSSDDTTGLTDTSGTSGTTDADSSGTQPACDPAEAQCGGACVDLSADIEHCGGCDAPCGAFELCGAGTCTPTHAGALSVLYLVPDGEAADAARLEFLRDATEHVQGWYRGAYGKTFDFSLGVVAGTHPREWYTCAEADTFNSCYAQIGQQLAELALPVWSPGSLLVVALQGNRVHYAGAQAQDQSSGVLIVGPDIFDVLIDRGCAPGECRCAPVTCDESVDGDAITGGIAHELGHSLGLPHPPDDIPDRAYSVMAEHWHYPDNGFLPDELAQLQANALVNALLVAP